jgi:hypothetical protein
MGLFIGLAVIALIIVTLILIILIVLLKRTAKAAAKSGGKKVAGIGTMQKRLFGRKNSQLEDPLPVVLLSYKADYDETSWIQGFSNTHFISFGKKNLPEKLKIR